MFLVGDERRTQILNLLNESNNPINGSELAKHFNVSRQVIVQDIALLRATNRDIISTNKGYRLYQRTEKGQPFQAIIHVKHSAFDTLEEMRCILDYGGNMLDVFVDHDLYGQIRSDLMIQTLDDALDFCQRMNSSTSKPLKVLTGDTHYHTISAPSEKALQFILKDLKEKQFLV